ncbi:efflux RND transporter permease subunit [Pseudoclavibacter chungangensis]|uniref:efflux RND transporter permease subunit n=1 Tax=Pseudoclavibacter chungangensis TaxID=587635 RepID=UPI00363CFDB6
MHRLAELSLRNRALMALVTVTIAVFGTLAMNSLKQELIPTVSLPVVSVITSYPGASPEIVDEDVSQPIESAMQGLEGLESTTATSNANLSQVSVQFTYGTDTVYAQQRIQQAVNRIESSLPESASTTILSGSIDDFPIIQVAVTGGDIEQTTQLLREQTLGDLTDIDGVRDATLEGAPTPRIAITPNPTLAAQLGITSETFRDALSASGVLIPVGELAEGDETLTVQAGTQLTSVEDIEALPLQGVVRAGAPVTIGEVATVVEDDEPITSISRVNGEDALTISITKRPDANTVAVSQAVREALPGLQSQLGAGVTLTTVFDQAPFIEQSIETLIIEGLLGLAMAVLVIFVFLLSFRATIVTVISIPTSLLVTFIGLQAADYSLNILTLGALTIAIGRVVDDSIVVIENIKRHMALHPAATRRPAERVAVIARAVREVAGAVTSATIATVAVYLPIAFVSDISGELFRPFALTSTIALLASLVVSLTIVPVLAYWLLRGGKLRARRDPSPELLPAGPGPRDDADAAPAGVPVPAGVVVGPHDAAGREPVATGTTTAVATDRRVRPAEERAKADRAVFAPLSLRDDEDTLRAAAESASAREPEAQHTGAHAAPPEEASTAASESRTETSPTPTTDTGTHPWVGGPVVDGEPIVTSEGVTPPSRRELRRRREAREASTGVVYVQTGAALPRPEVADGTVDGRTDAARANAAEPDAAGSSAAESGTVESSAAESGTVESDEERRAAHVSDAPAPVASPAAAPAAEPPVPGAAPAATLDATAETDDVAEPAPEDEPRTWVQRGYEPVLRWTVRHPIVTLVAALLVLVLTGALAPLMKTNFLGASGQNTFTVTQTLDAGASLDARDRAAGAVEDVLMATPGVDIVQLTISSGGPSGSAGLAAAFTGGGSGGATAMFSITLTSDADPAATQDAIRSELDGRDDVGDISISGDSSGLSGDLTVDVRAPTTETLRDATALVADAMRSTAGIVEVTSSVEQSRPYVQLEIDQEAAARAGLSEVAIGGIVAQRMQPIDVGDIAIDGSTVTVFVLGEEPPQNLDELRALPIPTATGIQPLSNFATVEITDGPVAITSQGGTPTASVTVVPSDDNLSATNEAIEAQLAGLALPAGASAELGGLSADQADAFSQLGLALLAAILIVYIVMVATFKSLLQPLLLLVSVPFAATGGVLLQLATGVPLGVASLIGVLMLIGVVVTNAIVLVDLVNQFRARGYSVDEALLQGGSRRVRPILMTSLATILALTPMGLGVTGHSGFISQPLAIIVIGGLLSSTVLTLLVLPALYRAVEGPIERARQRRAAKAEAQLRAAGID